MISIVAVHEGSNLEAQTQINCYIHNKINKITNDNYHFLGYLIERFEVTLSLFCNIDFEVIKLLFTARILLCHFNIFKKKSCSALDSVNLSTSHPQTNLSKPRFPSNIVKIIDEEVKPSSYFISKTQSNCQLSKNVNIIYNYHS